MRVGWLLERSQELRGGRGGMIFLVSEIPEDTMYVYLSAGVFKGLFFFGNLNGCFCLFW